MSVYAADKQYETRGFCHVLEITDDVQDEVRASGIRDGIANVFAPGATAAVTTIENEDGCLTDFQEAIERLAPRDGHYHHNRAYGDGNGFSHVRAALLGPSVAVPVRAGRLVLGTWQRLILVDFDNRSRDRRLAIQIVGE